MTLAKKRASTWLLSLALVLASCSGCARIEEGQDADLIFHNGAVWTVDEANPTAEAVAIRGNRIVAVGSDSDVLELAREGTELIDLGGAFVLPGFNDNHIHFASAAEFLEFNIMNVENQAQFTQRIAEVRQTLDPGEWILGGFWGAYDQWEHGSVGGSSRGGFTPDIDAIEGMTEDYPLFIRKFDNSEFAANRAGLRAVGLDPDQPRAKGIVFSLDSGGTPTGIMQGLGVLPLFSRHIPENFSHKRRLQQTRNALQEIRKYGVTSVSDISDGEQLEIYKELRAQGELTARVHFRPHLETWEALREKGIRVGSGDEWISLGAVKGHIDGIMGTSSARFFEPYSNDPENRGRWRRLMVDEEGRFEEGKFLQYMRGADEAGLQLSIHAIGDEANQLLLDYLEELERANGPRDRRFRLVHAQVLLDDDFARLGELGVIAEVQPFHVSDDMRWMEERIGPERCKGAYAFRRIAESGGVLTFGTDWPGTSASEYPINPMLGLYAAVTRQTLEGHPEGGWFPEERISIEEAIRAYTLNTAYSNFLENSVGSIEVGKLADLAVLSKNLRMVEPREFLESETLFTVVGGMIVFRKN